jgi:hypothetical protein
MKYCPGCKTEKSLDNFWNDKSRKDGLFKYCKICGRNRVKKYNDSHKQQRAEYDHNRYINNIDNIKKYRNSKRGIEVRKKQDRKRIKSGAKCKYAKNRYKNDVNFRVKNCLSSCIRNVLKKQKVIKNCRTIQLLGCSIEEFRIYIESQFKLGMNWGNYGRNGWHLDHIIPCAYFDLSDINQQKKCFHYTNFQPLWESENIKKGSNYKGKIYTHK